MPRPARGPGAGDPRTGSSARSANRLAEGSLSAALTARVPPGLSVPLEDSRASQEVLELPLMYQWSVRRLREAFTFLLSLRGLWGARGELGRTGFTRLVRHNAVYQEKLGRARGSEGQGGGHVQFLKPYPMLLSPCLSNISGSIKVI